MAENSDNQSSISDSSPPKTSDDSLKLPQMPSFPYFPHLQQGGVNMLPIMYPALIPGASTQNQEQMNRGPGIYAVPVVSYMGTMTGIPNTLIPLTYSTPTRSATSEAGAAGDQNQMGPQQPQQLPPNRQIVVRRLQIAFQLDLLLILKLAAVIFIFNQDGSRQRLVVLIFFGLIVYFYQTGALTPLMRWVSQAMHRAAAPPRPPRPAAGAEPVLRQGDENVAAEGQPAADNDNPPVPADDEHRLAENEGAPEAGVEGGNHWWGIAKEIQMIVFGFITSLLPGFHNMDHA